MFKGMRWSIAWLLFFAGMINYLDRSALSIVAPLITKDLHFTPAEMGLIFSSFFFGYAIFNFLGGYAADKWGAKKVLMFAMGLWSLFCGLTAVAFSFISLLIIRILFGAGEGPLCTTANKMVNNWFPRKEAASAVGVLSAGSPLGGAIAGPVVGFLAIAFDWRIAFVIIALLSLIWIGVWAWLTTEHPQTHPKLSREEYELITQGQITTLIDHHEHKPPLRYYLRQPAILVTALAFFSYNYVLYFFLTWFPSYLSTVHHLSLHNVSLATIIPWLFGFIGLALGGFVSDGLLRFTRHALQARKIILVSGLSITAVCISLAGKVTSTHEAILLMSIAIFFLYVTGASYWAIIQDTVPKQNVGSVGGFVHFLANLSGIIGPAVTGFIVQISGAFTGAFLLAGAIAITGALGVLIFLRPPLSHRRSFDI